MEKRIHIQGMSCNHCTARVEKALSKLEGVSAKVDLQGATVFFTGDVSDAALRAAVEDAGYEVTSIE